MQERDAYRIALLNAAPGDEQSFHEGWLSALTWQTEVLVDALASAGLHGNNTQTVLQEPQAAVTAKCPYSICGWVTYTHEAPLDLQRLHLEHAHPLPPPVMMPTGHQDCKAERCTVVAQREAAEYTASHNFQHGPTESGTCQANNYVCCEAGTCPPDYDCAAHTSVETSEP